MNNFCEFISKIAPNDAATVQAWAAVGAFGCAGLMAYYAKQALDTWKDKAHYKIYLKEIAQFHRYKFMFEDYLLSQIYTYIPRYELVDNTEIVELMIENQESLYNNKLYIKFKKSYYRIIELPDERDFSSLKSRVTMIDNNLTILNEKLSHISNPFLTIEVRDKLLNDIMEAFKNVSEDYYINQNPSAN